MDAVEREFHESYKPAWGPEDVLLYAIPGQVGANREQSTQANDNMQSSKNVIVSEGRDIRFAKFAVPNVSALCYHLNHKASTQADLSHSSSQPR